MSYQQAFTQLGTAVASAAGSMAKAKIKENKEAKAELDATKEELDVTNNEMKEMESIMDNITTDASGKLRLKGKFYSQKAFNELNDAYVSKFETQQRLQERFDKLSKRVGGAK